MSDEMAILIAEEVVKLLSPKIVPTIPLEETLWDLNTVALYLRKSSAYVRDTWTILPSFPKAIRLPSEGKAKGRPLYKATEVMKWVQSYIDKH